RWGKTAFPGMASEIEQCSKDYNRKGRKDGTANTAAPANTPTDQD
ncbi:unnamed protein product, partial [marine sediment metagenome]